MTKTNRARAATYEIPYAPEDWTPDQLLAHRATSMEGAFHAASSLAGGWYHRPVAIDYQIDANDNECYMLRPAEIAPLDGWEPCYEVKSLA